MTKGTDRNTIRSILLVGDGMSKRKTLGGLMPGQSGYVYSIGARDEKTRHRIIEMGITPGTEITMIKTAPMGDPVEIALRGYSLSIRKADAEHILLMADDEENTLRENIKRASSDIQHKSRVKLEKGEKKADSDEAQHFRAAMLTEFMIDNVSRCDKKEMCFKNVFPDSHDKPVRLALVGNPNCGKTTLFNAMTGAREYVGNWPGVTVEKKEGKIRNELGRKGRKGSVCTHGHEMTLVDLPGIYSLSPYSTEEIIARSFVVDEKPDAIINIVDGTNIERNLYLTIQLMELEVPMIIALNMMDEVEKNGDSIDIKKLSLLLGIPVIPISARTGMGLGELAQSMRKLVFAAHTQLHEGFNIEPDDVYDDFTRLEHYKIGNVIEPFAKKAGLPLHWAKIKVLEGDKRVMERLSLDEQAKKKVDEIIREYAAADPLMDNETMVADSRYRYITNVCAQSVRKAEKNEKSDVSEKIDRILTHKWLALPIFVGIMALIFTLTFATVGAWLSDMVGVLLDETVIPAARNALVNMNAYEWFTSLVCDGIITGVGGVLTFLPQIAILFFCLSLLEDSGYMSRIAFIMDKPMRKLGLSGKSFIPLLMGFGCSVPAAMGARTVENEQDKQMTIMLVPFMSCSAKLPVYGLLAGAFFAKGRGLVIISLYVFGVLAGILSGLLFRKTVFKNNDAAFIIELPQYRFPSMKNTFLHVWERVSHFLHKAGTIIFAMSVVLWFLQNFTFALSMTAESENSILGVVGSFIAPVFTPLGFGVWQAVVALLTGFVAKEAVVSALTMFYGFSASAASNEIMAALSGTFTPVSAYSFLVFVLLYTPCIAAVTTISRELHSRKKALLLVIYQIAVAYIVSMLFYTAGTLIFGG